MAGAVVVVAGGSGGLGSAIAAELVARGARPTLVARDPARLDAVPVSARRVALDLRTPEACQRAIAEATADGPLRAVVNATGLVAFGPVAELSIDAMEELFLTNVFLPIMLAQASLPVLAGQPGAVIVNISGVIAERNLPGMAAYGASKAAVRAFDEAFAREARRLGVRVLDARPPHTETGLVDRAIEGTAPPLGEGLTPSAVAAVIVDAMAEGTADLPSAAFQPVEVR